MSPENGNKNTESTPLKSLEGLSPTEQSDLTQKAQDFADSEKRENGDNGSLDDFLEEMLEATFDDGDDMNTIDDNAKRLYGMDISKYDAYDLAEQLSKEELQQLQVLVKSAIGEKSIVGDFIDRPLDLPDGTIDISGDDPYDLAVQLSKQELKQLQILVKEAFFERRGLGDLIDKDTNLPDGVIHISNYIANDDVTKDIQDSINNSPAELLDMRSNQLKVEIQSLLDKYGEIEFMEQSDGSTTSIDVKSFFEEYIGEVNDSNEHLDFPIFTLSNTVDDDIRSFEFSTKDGDSTLNNNETSLDVASGFLDKIETNISEFKKWKKEQDGISKERDQEKSNAEKDFADINF